MKPFHETDRYIYDLTPNSVCLDCGGYEGFWASEMWKKYGCMVIVFEPLKQFFEQTQKNLAGMSKVSVHHFGIGKEYGDRKFSIKGSMTGPYADNPETETVTIRQISEVWHAFRLNTVDVMKLNIEGMEFDVVEELIHSGLITCIKNLQVQWHDVAPNCIERYAALQQKLSETHELTFDAQWIWQNWRRKT